MLFTIGAKSIFKPWRRICLLGDVVTDETYQALRWILSKGEGRPVVRPVIPSVYLSLKRASGHMEGHLTVETVVVQMNLISIGLVWY